MLTHSDDALFNAEAGIGFKTANSSADSSSVVSQGSTLQAGGNLNLTSTSGDIHVVQGNLSAGNTVSLDSARDILLEAGKAHLQDKSKSSNAGAEVGVGVAVGAQTGVYVYAEASVGSSKSNANSTTWQNTTLTGQNISLKAEGDTVRVPHGELKGQPELPPRNAAADQVRSIERQNEAANALAKSGYDVEQLPNTAKNKPNPDLEVNGEIADVFSPITNSTTSVIKTIGAKVEKQAATIVANLEDSVITISQLEAALSASPVKGLKSVYIMKNGEIKVIKAEK